MKRLIIAILGCVLLASPALADQQEPAFDPTARQKPMQVITGLDGGIAGDSWVTIVYELDNAMATQLVPLLRPLVPQNGHLVGHAQSNTLTITDRYANIVKLIEIASIIDAATPPQEK